VQKPTVKIKIDKSVWVCEDTNGLQGKGKTPQQAWYDYKKKLIDNVIKDVYNYETSIG